MPLFWLHTLLLILFSVAFFVYSLPFVYSDFTKKKKCYFVYGPVNTSETLKDVLKHNTQSINKKTNLLKSADAIKNEIRSSIINYSKDLGVLQKQAPEVFCKKRCSWKFHKIHGKTSMPATLLKKRLWHRCFPVNFVKFLRAPFLQNTSGRLPLVV